MEQERWSFHHDENNRIQKLYYDVNINTTFNKTKLQNVKNKFIKYVNYLTKYKKTVIQPALLELEKLQDEAYKNWQRAKRISLIHNPTPENEEKRKALVPIFRKAEEECQDMSRIKHDLDIDIDWILSKINEIKTHQKKLKHYRECAHCEKKDMVTNCGCKSNHKLCSECIYDKTECPVCEEDLGLQYCAICMQNKKKIVETGCENKHQTCKECLYKIKQKYNNCPFCRGCCSKEPLAIPDYWREEAEEEARSDWQWQRQWEEEDMRQLQEANEAAEDWSMNRRENRRDRRERG